MTQNGENVKLHFSLINKQNENINHVILPKPLQLQCKIITLISVVLCLHFFIVVSVKFPQCICDIFLLKGINAFLILEVERVLSRLS